MRGGACLLRAASGPLLRLGHQRSLSLLAWHQPHLRQPRRQPRRPLAHSAAAAAAATTEASAGDGGAAPATPPATAPAARQQTFDYTALAAAAAELQEQWVPAKVEGVVQQEACTALRLRTPTDTGAPAAGGACS